MSQIHQKNEEPVISHIDFTEDGVLDLSPSHREYLLKRHGTVNLAPLPSEDPADPLNWSALKKNVNLALVAFHGMMSVASATAGTPAFFEWSKIYHTTITRASYIGSCQLMALAVGPLLWIPIANKYGRRPIWILSVLIAGLFNVGNALSTSYGVHLAMSILSAFFISPGLAMGQAVVTETFFAHQRATKMGIWALMISLGTPIGPFIMGFVIEHRGWRWVYRILAIINAAQLVLYILFSPETLYIRKTDSSKPSHKGYLASLVLTFHRIAPNPLCLSDFMEPLYLLGKLTILLPAISYAIVFNFTLVLITVEIPALVGVKFRLNAQQQGLNYVALLIGGVLGEQIGGPFSDFLRNRMTARQKRLPSPEQRLWIAHIGFPLVIAGIVIFFLQLDNAAEGKWNISPLIGIAIAVFGVQIVTTVIITYCSDSREVRRSPAIGVAINFVRCTWGFLGPFWFPDMFQSLGLRGSAGLISAIIVVFSIGPLLIVQYRGSRQSHHD